MLYNFLIFLHEVLLPLKRVEVPVQAATLLHQPGLVTVQHLPLVTTNQRI